MKERPILFSGSMVRAILEGRKTQTRRVAKFVPYRDGINISASSLSVGDYCTGNPEHGKVLYSMGAGCWQQRTKPLHCPYGKVGDSLWVREAWAYGCAEDAKRKIAVFRADAELDHCDARFLNKLNNLRKAFEFNRWRPSIHMPRWASRISLEVIQVKVERLQQINDADIQAEGIERRHVMRQGKESNCWRWSFAETWDAINAKRGYSWESNPWVWLLEFRPISEKAKTA